MIAPANDGPLVALLLPDGLEAKLFPQKIYLLVLEFVPRHVRNLDDRSSILYETLNAIEALLDLLEAIGFHELRLHHVQNGE